MSEVIQDTHFVEHDIFRTPKGRYRYIRIAAPDKKSGFRIVLQIAGKATKSCSLNTNAFDSAFNEIFILLLKHAPCDISPSQEKCSKGVTIGGLKDLYNAWLQREHHSKKADFEARKKESAKHYAPTLSSLIFNSKRKLKHFAVRAPNKKTGPYISINMKSYSKTISINNVNIEDAVSQVFPEFLSNFNIKFSDVDIEQCKAMAVIQLESAYENLKDREGVSDFTTMFDSLSGLFYRRGELKAFRVELRKAANNYVTPYITYARAGYSGMTRSLNEHGFDSAFDDVFSHACKQHGLAHDHPFIVPIKAIIKHDLRRMLN